MSTTQTSQHTQTQTPESILEDLWDNPGICPYCFGKKRQYHTEYEEELANHLAGTNTAALEARGHQVSDDGSLLVDTTATSDPDPSTFYDVVPPTEIDGRKYPARAQSVCECGVVDYDPASDRSKRELHEAVDNISDRLSERGIGFHTDAAHRTVETLLGFPALAGKDRVVLEKAIEKGLRFG